MNDQQVAWLRQRLDLSREDGLEAEVVAGRRQQRGVRGERDRRIRTSVPHVPHDILGREMLRVGGAPAIAAEEERPAAPHRVLDQAERDIELWTEGFGASRREG